MKNRIYTMMGMTLATALISTTAIAAQPQTEVVSKNCGDITKHTTLVALTPVKPGSSLPITAPERGETEKKDCSTTNAPATNDKGENGTNRCTTCTYSTNGHVTVNCIFIKTKNPSSPSN
jgi:hypothetical protein